MSLVALATPSRCCITLEAELERMFGPNTPSRIRQELNYLNMLVSDVNTSGFEAIDLNMFPGKQVPTATQKPSFQVKWRPAVCGGTSGTSVLGMCTDQSAWTDPYSYDEVVVTLTRADGAKIAKSDFHQICENAIDELAKDIEEKAYGILTDMTADLIAAHYAINGNYPCDGTDSVALTKTLNIINGSGFVNAAAFARLLNEFALMHTNRRPIIVGGSIVNMFQNVLALGGVGANALGAENPPVPNMTMDLAIDPTIQAITLTTNSYALSWLPGAVQLLEWFRYKDPVYEELGKENYVKTVINVGGWDFDYTLYYNECTETWDYELSKHFDLCHIPSDHFATCHDFNTKLLWILGCGDVSCTDFTC